LEIRAPRGERDGKWRKRGNAIDFGAEREI
jgi:hypothetical protein